MLNSCSDPGLWSREHECGKHGSPYYAQHKQWIYFACTHQSWAKPATEAEIRDTKRCGEVGVIWKIPPLDRYISG